MGEQPMVWIGLLVLFLIIEFLTLGLTTIWMAGGALAAFCVAMAGSNVGIQVVVFLAVTVLLLIITRPFAVKYINQNRTRTNVDSLIGKSAVVTEPIDNLESCGQAQVDGQIWTARASREEEKIPSGTKVKILSISGVKLIVEAEQ